MLELHPTSRYYIDNGNFPFNHDCILKVVYIADSPIRFQWFTCRQQDSGVLADVILKLSIVKKVQISTVDDLPINF